MKPTKFILAILGCLMSAKSLYAVEITPKENLPKDVWSMALMECLVAISITLLLMLILKFRERKSDKSFD